MAGLFKTLESNQYRHRFPPLPTADSEASQNEVEQYQQRLTKGFEVGQQQGFDQGFLEGVQKGQQQGHREGFEQGKLEAEQKVKAEHTQQVMPLIQALNQLQQNFSEQQADAQQELKQQLLKLVEKVSQQVIRGELSLHPEQIMNLIEETISQMPHNDGKYTIMLNPRDVALLQELAPEQIEHWLLKANPSIEAGGCIISTDNSEADATINQRLDDCMEAVTKHINNSTAEV
ncbi:flagellar assembly protein FliH [Paraferrimonas sp. SM1919]|uniref:flagellar assembly protein FliH n=1 Tax=Paraferrimonas sp. SM1919 TaxID=2662263 RepID=UPI0013D89C60|nr:flagellar assembly protein FliH [Paraferrimonas sp. SM1919]